MMQQVFFSVVVVLISAVFCSPAQGSRQMLRLAREDQSNHQDHKDDKPVPYHTLDPIGGGNLIRSLMDPYYGGPAFRSQAHLLNRLESPQGEEVLRMLNAARGSDLLSSMDAAYGSPRRVHPHPKRMLDSVSGWAFGESKRNFDEIDNVGFDNFAKRWGPGTSPGPRGNSLALAKRNFDEIDRTGFENYQKRNFDEIDRTGFENYQKRSVRK